MVGESLVLYSAFQYNLKQGDEDIQNRNKILLHVDEMEPQVLETTLKFIYKGTLDMTEPNDWNTDLAAGILKAAKRFGLINLQTHCLAKLASELSFENAGDSAILAYEYHATQAVVNQIHRFIRRYVAFKYHELN